MKIDDWDFFDKEGFRVRYNLEYVILEAGKSLCAGTFIRMVYIFKRSYKMYTQNLNYYH